MTVTQKPPARVRKKASPFAYVAASPHIVWTVLFIAAPLVFVLFYAFTDVEGAFTWENILALGDHTETFTLSFSMSVIATVLCLLIGYPVAYFMAHCKPATQKFLYMLVMLPMCMSFLLRTLAWVGLLQDTGIINSFLMNTFGLEKPLPLIRTSGAVILGMVYNYLPYMILPLYSTIVKIDRRLVEAAEDLGCNGGQVFGRVILPLSMPGIISGMTMVFVPAVSTFYISQKLGSTDIVLIGDIIERQFKQGDNPNMGAALSLLLMVLVFVCTGIINRFGSDEEGSVIV